MKTEFRPGLRVRFKKYREDSVLSQISEYLGEGFYLVVHEDEIELVY